MDKIDVFWKQFLIEKNLDLNTKYYESFHFERSEKWANELLRLVLKGMKKATSSLLPAYEIKNERLPQIGDLSVVTDWYGNPHCVIETTKVTLIPFKDMTYEICSREGEDDTLESWRKGHLKFFKAEAADLGFEFIEDMKVVFEDFIVIYSNSFNPKSDKLILRQPTKKDEKQIMEYKQEFSDYKEKIHGGCGLQEFTDYDLWLKHLKRMTDPNDLPEGRVVSSEYMSVRESDGKLIGLINIRHYLNEIWLLKSGHVGYSIRPTERQKGYANEQLRLALLICDDLGINPILITCNKENTRSRRTILKAGGIKENEITEDDGTIVERYWISRKK